MTFFVTLFSTILVVCGKVNFTNLSRYSRFNEKTYRRHFKAAFDFMPFNVELVSLAQGSGQPLLLVMDGSFITKSGKRTEGIDWYWNGCASRAEKGLEISLVGVVDIETETAYALSAQQTLAQTEIPRDITRLDQYLYHLEGVRPHLPPQVRYLTVDGAYAKAHFVSGAVGCQLDVISKLRFDANLRYLYTGEQKPRGRPRKYDGKVTFTDLSRFTFLEAVQPNVDLYTQRVWHVSLKRQIRVVYLIDRRSPHRVGTCLLFSTDVEQDPQQIVQFYKLRFQIEFLFRDAKQFAGLEDCQARDLVRTEFHFNASLTALNLAKVEASQQHSGQERVPFSMASAKRRALNQHLLDRFIETFDLEPTLIKSHPNYSTLCNYGIIAA
ncbi:transposase [Phormidium sp. CLA17]|nr:transposase [Leptolyngbya sp. Cla-17]